VSARRSRQTRQTARAELCGNPLGCDEIGSHVVVDPVYGGRFVSCEDHWPDLAGIIFGLGGWVTGCPCGECIGQGAHS
jgi:hypothetical protein